MYGYIYITINNINNKKYIGRHKANKFDLHYHGSGVALNNAIKKYGLEHFHTKIIDQVKNVNPICFSEDELRAAEYFYINYYSAVECEDYYNLVEGGAGSFKKNLKPWNKGLTTDDPRIKAALLKKITTEQKRNDAFYLINIYYKATQSDFVQFYKTHTHSETKARYKLNTIQLYDCLKINNITDAEIQQHLFQIRSATVKNSSAIKNSVKNRTKKIQCVETGQIFNCVKDAINIYGYHVSQAANGKRKTAAGYHWKYI